MAFEANQGVALKVGNDEFNVTAKFKRNVCEENDFARNFLYNRFSERPTAARAHISGKCFIVCYENSVKNTINDLMNAPGRLLDFFSF